MKIIYDDLPEFIEVRLRCENTRKKSMLNTALFMPVVRLTTIGVCIRCAVK